METPNVNNLNGVANFGHGLPDNGVVIAGVTDVPQYEKVITESKEGDARVEVGETPLGEQDGAESEESKTGDSVESGELE